MTRAMVSSVCWALLVIAACGLAAAVLLTPAAAEASPSPSYQAGYDYAMKDRAYFFVGYNPNNPSATQATGFCNYRLQVKHFDYQAVDDADFLAGCAEAVREMVADPGRFYTTQVPAAPAQ